MLEALVLAVALSLDAAAVAAACGAVGFDRRAALRMATVFALFHIAMCTIGWMIGTVAAEWISAWDHWVAFALLTAIGCKMVVSALRPGAVALPASWGMLLGLALATSIDAIAAGVTIPLLDPPELASIAMIGSVVFVFVLVGARIGVALGGRFGTALQVVGGLAITGIGVRILVEHL